MHKRGLEPNGCLKTTARCLQRRQLLYRFTSCPLLQLRTGYLLAYFLTYVLTVILSSLPTYLLAALSSRLRSTGSELIKRLLLRSKLTFA